MWSRKYENCVNCGSSSEKHIARGLCAKCYQKDVERRHKRHPRGLKIAAKMLTKRYLVEEYFKGSKSPSDIAKACGCSRQYVYKKMAEHNIPLRSKRSARRLALKQKKIAVIRMDDMGRTRTVIHQEINFNSKFFASWIPEMAYVLGVVYTDGCLDLTEHSGKTTVRRVPHLSVAQKEPELLRKILALMDCTAKLHFRKRMQYGNKVAGELYFFDLICTSIYPDLLRLGLNPRKSLGIKFPKIPSDYVRHFIRDCWDGYGSVYFEKRRKNYLIASYYSGSL